MKTEDDENDYDLPVTAADRAYLDARATADGLSREWQAAEAAARAAYKLTTWSAEQQERVNAAYEHSRWCAKNGCRKPSVLKYPGNTWIYLGVCDEHRCQATTRAGERCKAWARGADALCRTHQAQALRRLAAA